MLLRRVVSNLRTRTSTLHNIERIVSREFTSTYTRSVPSIRQNAMTVVHRRRKIEGSDKLVSECMQHKLQPPQVLSTGRLFELLPRAMIRVSKQPRQLSSTAAVHGIETRAHRRQQLR